MKNIRKKIPSRILALLLVLVLFLAPAVRALTVEQARELLTEYYVDEIPDQVLAQDTVKGIIDALGDPYTAYMDPEEYAAFLASMEDEEIVGIGVTVSQDDSGLLISGILSDSPAEEAGLTVGDIIIEVDGQSTAGQDANIVAGWIRGEEGTQVTITVLHSDGSEEDYTLTRRSVVIPATVSELLDGHIGYFLCETFGEDTPGHFLEGMDAYTDQADDWIVDLRTNGGGSLSAAVTSLGYFLGEGDIVYLRDGNGSYMRYVSTESSQTMYPVIVLTSQWTASASEIYAAAIRDADDGLVIGSRTYGKGVAQLLLDQTTLPDYFSDGSALKVTAYRYFSVNGNTADKIGVIPHLLVSDENAENIAMLLCATVTGGENKGILRLHLGGRRWYINPDEATSGELRPAFTELLEALPPDAELYLGEGYNNWSQITVCEAAEQFGLDYSPRVFSDVADSLYQTEIDTLSTYRILKGCGDGLFHPDDTLTRAELCALLAQVMNYTSSTNESVFSDVPADAWYAPYVNTMQEMGLVKGCGDGQFHPLDVIDHEQLITIMARLADKLNLVFYENDKTGPDENTLADASLSAYSDWAKDSVWLLGKSQHNLLGGEINLLFEPVDELDPSAGTQREEAAALVYSLLSYTGILPVS